MWYDGSKKRVQADYEWSLTYIVAGAILKIKKGRVALKMFEKTNQRFSAWFIPDSGNADDSRVRIRHGLLAGWTSIVMTFLLFVLKMALGLKSGSISVVADAFHLLSHLANSVILVVTFYVTGKPATAKTPFGHGRMEQVAPLIMSIFLFVSAIQIGEQISTFWKRSMGMISPGLRNSWRIGSATRFQQLNIAPFM